MYLYSIERYSPIGVLVVYIYAAAYEIASSRYSSSESSAIASSELSLISLPITVSRSIRASLFVMLLT